LAGLFTTTKPYSKFDTVPVSLSFAASIRTGLRKDKRQRSSTFFVIVAENNRVTLSFGYNFKILFISSSNPIFRMASASSIINIYKLWKINPSVFSK